MSFFTKIVEVEKVVEKVVERVVLGEAVMCNVFRAYTGEPTLFGEKHIELGTYLSCKEAFATDAKAKVERLDAIRVGGEFYVIKGIKHVKIGKPKAAKSAKEKV